MAYYELSSNEGYIADYEVGPTGATDVVIEPVVKSRIENAVDSYINGYLGRTFGDEPIIENIAGQLSMWQIIMRITPGRDPSNSMDREAAWRWKEMADEQLLQIKRGEMDLYSADGASKVSVSTKEAKSVYHGGTDDDHVFKLEELPENWGDREEVYDG